MKEKKSSLFKSGDKVRYIDEGVNGDIFTVYYVYNDEYVSLGLRHYPDIEQDVQTHVSSIQHVQV